MKLNKESIYKAVYFVGVAVATISLNLLPNEIGDYWNGYSVEIAGILLEIGVVYLIVDNLLSRASEKRNKP